MNKLASFKKGHIITLAVIMLVVALPLVAGAQFTPPNAGGTGLPNDSSISGFILKIINIALAIAGLVAVLFLIIGGFRYITAAGNEETAEKAKKIILNAIIGIVVIILSFVIVRVISNALTTSSV